MELMEEVKFDTSDVLLTLSKLDVTGPDDISPYFVCG